MVTGAVMPDELPEARCPCCGRPVDPLRAGQVAILEGRFEYFCGSECKQSYLRAGGATAHEDLATAEPPPVASLAAPRAVVAAASDAALPAPTLTPASADASQGEKPDGRGEDRPRAPRERA